MAVKSKLGIVGIATVAVLALLVAALAFYPPPQILAQSASLTATVNANKSVDLAISNHQGNWWFRINSGTCTAVTGTSISGIKGYKPGTYSVKAYSNSNCSAEIAATTFTILATSLAATVDSNRAVNLTITNGPSPWYFRISNSSSVGSCTTVNGTTIAGIKGYQPGYHEVLAFATAGCSDPLADAFFVIPDPPPSNATLTTTVTAGPAANLTLTNGPSNNNWWFRINSWGTCTAVAGSNTFNNIRGYQAGTHSVNAYSDDGCYTKIASSSFTIPTFAATRNDDWSVDLTLTDWPGNWWFKIGWWGDCTAASGTTVSNIRGYKAGWYIVGVYPAAGCAAGDHIAMDSFTIPTATLTANVDESDNSVDLTLSNGPSNWWFRINYWGTCTATSGTTFSNIRGYQPGTHAVAAYSDSGCNYHVTATTFTIEPPTLTASAITNTGATLTIANHTGQWWYQADTGPDATCQGPVATNTSTKTLTGLTPSTTYTYSAYSASGCNSNDLLATASAFTTLSPSLTATTISGTGATLNMTGYTSAWSYKRTAGPSNTTCSDISAGTTTATLGSLTADTLYGYTSYSGSGCTTANKLDTVHFSTTNYGVGNLDETAAAASCAIGHPNAVNRCAVAFTTGARSGGYTLKSVSGNFAAKTGTPGAITVAIHAADTTNSSNPASSATVTLSGSNPDTAGLHTYTCSGSGCDLSASTTYFVVMSTPDTSGFNWYNLRTTTSDAEIAHPATNGWSIANEGRSKLGTAAWADFGNGRTSLLHIAANDLAPTVSNLSETSTQGSPSTSGGAWIANEFTTGSNTNGYTVTNVTAPISPGSGASNVTLQIYSKDTSTADPNTSLVTLTNTGDTAGNYTFSCSGSCDLTASTSYFLVLNSDSGYSHSWASTASDNQTSSAGWSIGNVYTASTNSGSTWTADANGHATKFSIMATPK